MSFQGEGEGEICLETRGCVGKAGCAGSCRGPDRKFTYSESFALSAVSLNALESADAAASAVKSPPLLLLVSPAVGGDSLPVWCRYRFLVPHPFGRR